MGRRFVSSDPTANRAVGNVAREGKPLAQQKTRRRIVDEFPDTFADLNPAQRVTITLAAAKYPGITDAWDITAEHLEQAKVEYFRDAR